MVATVAFSGFSQFPGLAAGPPLYFGAPGSGPGQFDNPSGVAVAPNGEVYVADRGNNRVQAFSPEGSFLRQWSSPCPYGIASDGSGVYVSTVCTSDGSVTKYTFTGTPLWTSPALPWTTHVAVQSSTVFVASGTGSVPDRIARLSPSDGSAIGPEWSVGRVTGLAVAPDSGLWVGDNIEFNNSRVKLLNASGQVSREVTVPPGWGNFLATDADGGLLLAGDCTYMNYLAPGSTQVRTFTEGGANCYNGVAVSPDGGYLYAAAMYNASSQPVTTRMQIERIDIAAPSVQLAADVSGPLTGQPVRFTATASSPTGSITSFAWDFDSDGVIDRSTTEPSTTTTYSQAGAVTATVKATTLRGDSATATTYLRVYAAPPEGEPGISINSGSPYTNKKSVTLDIVWPAGATEVRISNDGGFSASRTTKSALAPQQSWTLDDSVKGLYTKVVYARFTGEGVDATKTYSDDIILDTTPPEVTAASASQVGGSGAAVLASAKSTSSTRAKYRLQVKARDRLTGVRALQVGVAKKPGKAKTVKYRKRLTTSQPTTSRLFIRVQDGAGNWTAWRKIRVK